AKVLSSGALRFAFERVEGSRWWLRGRVAVLPGFLRGAAVWGAGRFLGRVRDDDLAAGWIELEEKIAEAPAAGDNLALVTGEEAPVLAARLLTRTSRGGVLPVGELRIGTTRGTNALLEGKGARVGLVMTRGFGDLPRIRDQKRPELFARVAQPRVGLDLQVWEVPGRLAADGREIEPLDGRAVVRAVAEAREAGCEAIAVSLLHAHLNGTHEAAVCAAFRAAGFRYVVGSAELRPFIHYLNRTETAAVDATLGPILEAYLEAIAEEAPKARLFVMTSGGGLSARAQFRAKDSLLSGPAGGVAGAAAEARKLGLEQIITFDMGGTSTDVARWAGDFSFQEVQTVGPARVLARSVRIETVAAGGGSICRVEDGRLLVGPESASADPGPACYGGGGPLTVTDVNLLLGRLDPEAFSIPIDLDAAERALKAEAAKLPAGTRREELLEGWLSVANLRMAQAIRQISVGEGYDPPAHALVAFGGAGGLHACSVAELLGMRSVVFPHSAGLLSAEGIAEATLETIAERQLLRPLDGLADELAVLRAALLEEATGALSAHGVPPPEQVVLEASVDLRLRGQESTLTVPWGEEDASTAGLAAAFAARFASIFGYRPEGRELEVATARLRLGARKATPERETFPGNGPPGASARQRSAVVAGEPCEIDFYEREALRPGDRLPGPAVVADAFSTLFVAPGWEAVVGDRRTLRLVRGAQEPRGGEEASTRPAVVQRELLLHRLYGMVGEMGEQLRRTALSANIRERLDFSCALLDAEGRLLINAPHIPVHLGALGECVRAVLRRRPLREGDVILTNHPGYGGSHLPDVTLLQGVFIEGRLLAILANRAHHAEWGGRRPGSMPTEAKRLVEEGVVFTPQLLFDRGVADWAGVERALREAPFPSRAVAENLADLHAQVAALRAGADGLTRLAGEVGEAAVCRFLGEAGGLAGGIARRVLTALPDLDRTVRDTLDDGTPLAVRVVLRKGRLRIDFSGTGAVHPGNLNATPAIVRSAVLYIVRLLVDEPVPLNEGLLEDVDIVLPEGLLNPPFVDDPAQCPAVVGGNVETSQRVVDLLAEALGLCAHGPGTMNNVLFGGAGFGYYETIGGGAGAGPGIAGGSGLHVHMTNTAMTDPEVLEQRFPVRLWQFAYRAGSGGAGRWSGGDGLVREYEWLAPMSVSLLTQRRAAGPRGAEGGQCGQPGAQWQRLPGETAQARLSGIHSWEAEPGERLRLETPGGGGWGAPARPEFRRSQE
ncbi:MAG: hydantoinase B/oxoprolinase family protein, partial [Opitutales bacterium]